MVQSNAVATNANGVQPPPSPRRVEDDLMRPLTEGYRPTLPLWALWMADTMPQFYLMRDIELMIIHPVVHANLNYFKAGISNAEFDVKADQTEVADFVLDHCKRYWDRGVPKLQGGYEYGWIGCEALYADVGGKLVWDDLVQFSPRDCFLLTQAFHPIGVRVKNINQIPGRENEAQYSRDSGTVDLWMATSDVPAKGLWYAHNPRYNQFYGQSQLLGAWRPWRRLAWKDGAEQVVDGGIYRFAYSGVVVKYPDEDYQAPINTPATTIDSQGNARRYARDVARQIAEWYKTGAGVGIPSTKYPQDLGGGDKWSVEIPKSTLNIDGLLSYVSYLAKQISYGVGVPPELLEAAETGSGYSGRAIPLEGFLTTQQRIADALLSLFVTQVLKPLVRWNFGPVPFTATVKNLLESKRQAQMGGIDSEGGLKTNKHMPGSVPEPMGSPPAPGQFDKGLEPPGPNQSGGFSLLVTDRIREIARKILRRAA